jgi:uncharacterized protein
MNRLARETSPYLLQHAHNPVDWYPWGSEAFERARGEDRPILLSVGYAACHWCHVMERESFEDEGTARLMNERFVCVKVDREERPDVDAVYMQAVQAMTGHGGWPMTVFLTPDGAPFYGGTYFPPEDRPGMPSFRRLLLSVSEAFRERRAGVDASAAGIRAQLYGAAAQAAQATGALSAQTLELAARDLSRRYDERHGGFGAAPKFPQAMALDFALSHWARTGATWARDMAAHTFRRMARGGMYDQVGGGFARYSVDARWLVPHFEKMLYDNALLARLGVRLWQATGDEEARDVAAETIDWVAREMTSPEGGFYSSLDADSEGEEGKFYLWDERALDEHLQGDAALVRLYWGVTKEGNFEGRNILHVPHDVEMVARRTNVEPARVRDAVRRAKQTLYEVRARRVWPARDDKVLASWNGLMLRAVCEAARASGSDAYRRLALANGEFLRTRMVATGRVLRSYKDGDARIPGFLEDHAAVGLGFLALWELTFDPTWLDQARALGESTVAWFWDEGTRQFYDTAHDAEPLITRPRDPTDNATPSGTSLAADLLLRLAELTGDADLRRRATWVLETLAEPMAKYGVAFGHLLGVADMAVHGATEIAIAGRPDDEHFRALAGTVGRHYVPALVLAGGDVTADARVTPLALMRDRAARDGRATAYVCRGYACDEPAGDADVLERQLEKLLPVE